MSINWQYQNHPNFSDNLLVKRSEDALLLIASKAPSELNALIGDTRPIHGPYFSGLTPPQADYFAGHYRGEDFPLLKRYSVSFGGRSGVPPSLVEAYMYALTSQIYVLFGKFELVWSIDLSLTPAQRLYRLSEVVTCLFVAFLDIHPYADGNGHMSRMLIHICFARYGFKRLKMPLHPRPTPTTASLAQMIDQFRLGDRHPLILYFLSTL